MIRVGLSATEQRQVVANYLATHAITRVVTFTAAAFPFTLEVPAGITYQSYDYTDIILYKVFYPLLEVIDERTLLIFHQCLRTQNRNDLTYNCAHHYANQTRHVLVFESFPLIEQPQDIMILLDYATPGKYKGRGYDRQWLAEEDVRCAPRRFTLEAVPVAISTTDRARYTRKKEQLFAALGQGDPETLPRQLHLFAGNLKRSAIQPERSYVARNDRFKLPNVLPYKVAGAAGEGAPDYSVVDFPHRRLDFNDFLARTGLTTIRFLHSGLPVDDYYWSELHAWVARLESLYKEMPRYA